MPDGGRFPTRDRDTRAIMAVVAAAIVFAAVYPVGGRDAAIAVGGAIAIVALVELVRRPRA